jgi:hypothetical protein
MLSVEEYEAKFGRCYCKGNGQPWILKEGMLLFDENAATYLAPAFNGNYAYFKIKDSRLIPNWDVVSEEDTLKKWRLYKYCLPNWKDYGHDAKNEDHLSKRLAKLTQKEIHQWHTKVLKLTEETPTLENPIMFYICGEDDASWTKHFKDIDHALIELKFLTDCEPLDFDTAIKLNGFYFSN